MTIKVDDFSQRRATPVLILSLILQACVTAGGSSGAIAGEGVSRLSVPFPVSLERHIPANGSRLVTSASGLILQGSNFIIAADDQNDLMKFNLQGEAGKIVLDETPLPEDHDERKKLKADLESLTQIQITTTANQLKNFYLAFPSGSKKIRTKGFLVDADNLQNKARAIHFDDLFSKLRTEYGKDLNIEGIVVKSDAVYLFQRGNGPRKINGVIKVERNYLFNKLAAQPAPLNPHFDKLVEVKLGSLNGDPIGFSDAVALGRDHILFTGAAEAGDDTVADGPTSGSVIGLLDQNLKLVWMRTIARPNVKIEGLAVGARTTEGLRVHLVTDADDPTKPSELLSGLLSGDDLRGVTFF